MPYLILPFLKQAKIKGTNQDNIETGREYALTAVSQILVILTKECILNERLEELNKNLKLTALTVQDIAEVIENWTKIPVTKITEAETQKLLNLENNLHKRIIGQN